MQNVETNYLRLNWDKAVAHLGWQPAYSWEDALAEIVAWVEAHQAGQNVADITRRHIANYVGRAQARNFVWVA